MEHPFLTARWTDLLLVTWRVPDELLVPHLGPGLVLDRWDGSALASLVAFDFSETRVHGIAWPGFVRFPELNLRFYVRQGGRRGVVFIREYVPGAIVAALARLLYREPYRAVPYRRVGAAHLLHAGGREHRITWRTRGEPFVPPETGLEHFLKEHSWGFGRTARGDTSAYRVDHPVWAVWPHVETELDLDPGLLHGPAWSFLLGAPPLSTIAAVGSPVAVFPASASAASREVASEHA